MSSTTAMNPDILEERKQATFQSRRLAALLFGGEQNLTRMMEIANLVYSNREFDNPKPLPFLTRMERVENAARKAAAMIRHRDEYDIADMDEGAYYQRLIHGVDVHPFALHFVMFMQVIQGQGTKEQNEKWLPVTYNVGINGTYAQTEIAHGTNVRALETTATFDRATDEFVLHSPSVRAGKCWPGNLAKFTNHAAVMAQLIIDGKSYGPHAFLVQTRDLHTHKPMPGVTLRDIGPKFGMTSNDNGFLMLRHVRIPRENMFMKHTQVLPDGTYVRPKFEKSGYGAMMFVRAVMIKDQAIMLAQAATIAIRYSTVRRQGEITPGKGEAKILDYETQQYRLLPELATAFAYFFVGQTARKIYMETLDDQSLHANVLADLHAVSSGLKSTATWDVARGIEQCRQACGGHGYAHYSGLPELYASAVGGCTYEGDNIVMLLQVARYLMKSLSSSRPPGALTAYLDNRSPSSGWSLAESCSLDALTEAFEHAARHRVFVAKRALEQAENKGQSRSVAWSNNGVLLAQAARAHTRVFVSRSFVDAVRAIDDVDVRRVMSHVCRLYLVCNILRRNGQFVEAGMSLSSLSALRVVQHKMLHILRPDAVPLVDSWMFHDRELASCLGRYDGNVYPAIVEWMNHSELNDKEVIHAHTKHIAPLLKENRAKL